MDRQILKFSKNFPNQNCDLCVVRRI